jgi:hypothetical protein
MNMSTGGVKMNLAYDKKWLEDDKDRVRISTLAHEELTKMLAENDEKTLRVRFAGFG